MLNILIDCEKTIVENTTLKCKWKLKTVEFLGDVYATLEKSIPDFKEEQFVSLTVKMMLGKSSDKPVEIFGCREFGTTFYALITFVGGKTVFLPTLKDVEKMRIEYKITSNYLPVSLGKKDSMYFEGLRNVAQVMIVALYYYAYHGYKIVCCKHCGKWFATKTLKQQYCKRTSPCINDIIKSKRPINCEQAVRNIKQKQSRRHRNIYSYLSMYANTEEKIEYFKQESKKLKEIITKFPSVENFKNYENFLDQYPKRIVKK